LDLKLDLNRESDEPGPEPDLIKMNDWVEEAVGITRAFARTRAVIRRRPVETQVAKQETKNSLAYICVLMPRRPGGT
jgi:hypothetical protein